MDYYVRLTNFYHQFQAIGNNYNQTVKGRQEQFQRQACACLAVHKLKRPRWN